MLSPEQFTAGTLASAKPPTLILPRSDYERTILVIPEGEGIRAVILDDGQFSSFECTGNDHFAGMLVNDIRFEIDEAHLFDARSFPVLGSLVRVGTELKICATPDGRFVGRHVRYTVLDGLPPCSDNENVGFPRWQIVVGESRNKQVLRSIEVQIPTRN